MQILTDSKTEEKKEKSEDKANSPKAYWLEKTRKKLGINKRTGKPFTFGAMIGMAGDWSVNKIKRRYNECEKADIPFAPLWHWKRNNE